MDTRSKTLYLWDLADTLFGEEWNTKKTGLTNFDAYIESLGYNLKTIDAKTYEWNYERPFKDGLMELSLMPGFVETLLWTKHNAVFTTGNREQIQWRAEVFLKKVLPDIRSFFQKIYSTFDYGNTNKKTTAMFLDILKQNSKDYGVTVYTDNDKTNCKFFILAAKLAIKQGINIKYRVYNVKDNLSFVKKIKSNYFQIGSLLQLLEQEKLFAKKTKI